MRPGARVGNQDLGVDVAVVVRDGASERAVGAVEVEPDALPGIAVCGVLWFAAYSVALNAAERRLDAGTASMLVNVGPS